MIQFSKPQRHTSKAAFYALNGEFTTSLAFLQQATTVKLLLAVAVNETALGADKNANDGREKQFAEATERDTMLRSRKEDVFAVPIADSASIMTQSINHPRNAGRLVVFCVLFADVAPRHELSFLFCGITLRSRSGVHRGISPVRGERRSESIGEFIKVV